MEKEKNVIDESAKKLQTPERKRKQGSNHKSPKTPNQNNLVAWQDEGSDNPDQRTPITNDDEGLEFEIVKALNDPHGEDEVWDQFVEKFKEKSGLDVESRVDTVERLISIFRGTADNLINEAVSLLLDMKQQDLDETLAYKRLNDHVQDYKEAEENIREVLEELTTSISSDGAVLKLRNVLGNSVRRADCEKVQLLVKSIDRLGDFPIFNSIKEKCGNFT